MAASKKPSASAKWRHGAGGRISGIAEEKAAAKILAKRQWRKSKQLLMAAMANKREGGGGGWHRGAKIRRGENGWRVAMAQSRISMAPNQHRVAAKRTCAISAVSARRAPARALHAAARSAGMAWRHQRHLSSASACGQQLKRGAGISAAAAAMAAAAKRSVKPAWRGENISGGGKLAAKARQHRARRSEKIIGGENIGGAIGGKWRRR
jgi:hypothetical protein